MAYCLMNRSLALAPEGASGLLGTARAPYTNWQWKEMDQRIRHPKLLRLPDKRIIATVGLFDGKVRTSVCEFHPATGKFTELLELPTGGHAVATALAWHDGQLGMGLFPFRRRHRRTWRYESEDVQQLYRWH
jgi:hypothetical protein